MTLVKVIQNSLKYRLFNQKKGAKISVTPKIGDFISLPDEVLDKEINSGNVRKLLKEEEDEIRAKKAKIKRAKELRQLSQEKKKAVK